MNKDKILEMLDQITLVEKDALPTLIDSIKQELDEEFQELKRLLNSEEWPEAVLSFQICDEKSEEEKMDRAEGLVDILIDDSLKDKKFLDFGCGEGHMAKYASTQETKISVGYDVAKSENSKYTWEHKQ